jgi:DNA polymerase-1
MPAPTATPAPDASRPALYLLDGYALLYRAFFAMIARPLTTRRGENTSAAWGVATFLLRLLETRRPAYLAWVQDVGESFRHRTYTAYKATREKLSEELQQDFDRSVERVGQLLGALRVAALGVDGYEADDVIGTLATAASARGVQVVIVSGDKDFYQLVAPGITLLNPGRGGPAAVEEHWVDPSNAAERFGVPPERVVDYLALVGDSSDNVPGVKGVGEKTALELLRAYGDLDTVLARAGEVSGKRPREALLAHAAEARLSRDLVTIRRDVPITLDLDALRVQPPDVARLTELFTELEFRTLIPRAERLAAGRAAAPASASPAATAAGAPLPPAAAPVAARIVDEAGALPAVATAIRAAGAVALEPVLDGGDPLRAPLVGLALATAAGGTWYLPLAHAVPEGELVAGPPPRNLPPLGDPAAAPLAALLADAAVAKCGHDLGRTWLALRRAGIELGGVAWDAMLAGYVLDPGRRSFALEDLARERLPADGVPPAAPAPLAGRAPRPVRECAVSEVAAAAAARGAAVWRLRAALDPEVEDHALRRLLETVERPLIRVLVDMAWRGMLIDRALLAEIGRGLTRDLAELEQALYRAAGTEFNLLSTPQLRTILFGKLQLPVLKKTKTGPSTDAEVLEQLAAMGHELPRLLLEYRELAKLKSTYVDALPGYVHPETGRIHSRFNQVGAATGRISSADPNLQNIPVRTARGGTIRRAFVAPPGHVLLTADYSQIELRLLAHLSGDPAFVAAFERGGDIHRQTAAVIFGVPEDRVTAEMRARAKTINFATIYGQGPFALARQLGITQDEARTFIAQYFERFAGVRAWLDRTVVEARARGFVETIFRRRRYIPELKDRNFNVRAFGERTATNSPLQGSAADLIKVAMVRLHGALAARRLGAGIVLQVHDELVLEVPAAEQAAATEVVKREMEGAAALRVPLIVTIGVGSNWLDAKA